MLLAALFVVVTLHSLSVKSLSIPSSRRHFLECSRQFVTLLSVGATSTSTSRPCWAKSTNLVDDLSTSAASLNHPFVYTADWIGTKLPLLTLEQAIMEENTKNSLWVMGRWPDPILRRPATHVGIRFLGTTTLRSACELLQRTAQAEGAVGLAAQQCGVDARLVYLEQGRRHRPVVMVNPRIIRRSPETQVRVWEEHCLVLPPTFVATVLRDEWVDVAYLTWEGHQCHIRLHGEASRCVQHELDHDRGILVTDHVALEELESDIMRQIEQPGHQERMELAYARQVDDRLTLLI